ncbi:uncharacterized protein LOC113217261 [Frankliniella occidentalis]|uniref:Uncharacterized protein LOC113217261 n=1 Tax=Frankliniella occidentalis TaxID=133901 RepID=A0A6J1TMK6_FRAOC|nr:uncharacterized protein LOC113217261 [Frankliniella occidentalis]
MAAALVALLLAAAHLCAADIEILEEYGCPDTAFQLTCRSRSPEQGLLLALDPTATSSIAVLEASFSARDAASIFLGANRTCGGNHTASGPRTIRRPVNRRCSGRSGCNFTLNSDFASSRAWGPGLVHLKYACISGKDTPIVLVWAMWLQCVSYTSSHEQNFYYYDTTKLITEFPVHSLYKYFNNNNKIRLFLIPYFTSSPEAPSPSLVPISCCGQMSLMRLTTAF